MDGKAKDPMTAVRQPQAAVGSPSRAASSPLVVKSLTKRLLRLAQDGGGHASSLEPLLADVMDLLRQLALSGDWAELGNLAAAAKALRLPTEGLDLLRAYAFVHQGNPAAAREALKEELRYFPGNQVARDLLGEMRLPEDVQPVALDPELADILPVISPYTMVGLPRLKSLFYLAKTACLKDIPGDFVECGVAAGGTSALLAWAIQRFSRRSRRLYSCDTFSGMPDPGDKDVHGGMAANDTGWGAGTCAAPEESVLEVCRKLGVEHVVAPVKGLFKDTLPPIAASLSGVALLHMDGDWYESTRDILVNLYDLVVPGGGIQVDDYGYWEGCDIAWAEFVRERGLTIDLHRVAGGVGAWCRKPFAAQEPR